MMRIFGCFRPRQQEQVTATPLDTRQQGGPADLGDRAPERGSTSLGERADSISHLIGRRSAAANSQLNQQQRRPAHFAVPGDTTALGPRSDSNGMADRQFNSLTEKQKIEWLVDCVTEIRARQTTHEQQYIVAGTRCLTPREAMTYALELAFKSSRADVQIVSQRLLSEYSKCHRQFLFFGIPFDKIYLGKR